MCHIKILRQEVKNKTIRYILRSRDSGWKWTERNRLDVDLKIFRYFGDLRDEPYNSWIEEVVVIFI